MWFQKFFEFFFGLGMMFGMVRGGLGSFLHGMLTALLDVEAVCGLKPSGVVRPSNPLLTATASNRCCFMILFLLRTERR